MNDQEGWTEERVARLKTMLDQGLSCSQIATVLGGGVTRNAVIGKVHRMGLGKGRPVRDPGKKPHGNRSVDKAGNIVARVTARREDVAKERAKRMALAPAMPDEPLRQAAELYIPPEQRLNLLQLTEHTCRWPIGDPLQPDFYFCGGEAIEGKPYCEFHARRAYTAAPAPVPRVRTPASMQGLRRRQAEVA